MQRSIWRRFSEAWHLTSCVALGKSLKTQTESSGQDHYKIPSSLYYHMTEEGTGPWEVTDLLTDLKSSSSLFLLFLPNQPLDHHLGSTAFLRSSTWSFSTAEQLEGRRREEEERRYACVKSTKHGFLRKSEQFWLLVTHAVSAYLLFR